MKMEERRNAMFLAFGLGEEVLKNLKENPSTLKVVLKMAKSSIFTTDEISTNKETSIDVILDMIEELKLTDEQSVILLEEVSKLAEILLKEELETDGKSQQPSPYIPYQPYMGPNIMTPYTGLGSSTLK